MLAAIRGQWWVRANLPTIRPLRTGDKSVSHLHALETVTLCDPSCTCYAKPGRRQRVWGCWFETLLSCHRLVRRGRRGQHSTRDDLTGDFWVLITYVGVSQLCFAAMQRWFGETKRITFGPQIGRFFELFENVTWPGPKICAADKCVNNFSKEEKGRMWRSVLGPELKHFLIHGWLLNSLCMNIWRAQHNTATIGRCNNKPTLIWRLQHSRLIICILSSCLWWSFVNVPLCHRQSDVMWSAG